MRLRSLVGAWVLSFVVFAMCERDGLAQFGSFNMQNPDHMFGLYARMHGARDELEIEKITSRMDPQLAGKMKAYAARVGITNGKLNRTQFSEFWTREALPQLEERMKQRVAGFGGFGSTPGAPGSSPAPTTPAPSTGTKTTTTEKDRQPQQPSGYQPRPFNEEEAKRYFERMDEDKSKALDESEYRRSDIRRRMDLWDTNRDNLIVEAEWLAYMKDRHDSREKERQEREEERRLFEEFKAARKARELLVPIGPLMPEKPVIIRADNLPEELPGWFKELNTDGDAQISLFEWRTGEKDYAEFRRYDRNNDGLITPDEVLWCIGNAERLAEVESPRPTEASAPTAPTGPEKVKTTWGGWGIRTVDEPPDAPPRP